MKDTLDGKIWLNRKPGMHSLDTETGNILWSKITDTECKEIDINCDPGISAAVTAIPGAVIAGHLDGMIRVYDKDNGDILWSFNSLGIMKAFLELLHLEEALVDQVHRLGMVIWL